MKYLIVIIGVFLMCFNRPIFGQTILQDLPKINDISFSFMLSTYDRTGLNADAIRPDNTNYYDIFQQGKVNNPNGTATNKKEYVVCNVVGPAVLERFWTVTFPIYFDARYRFYFDGEPTPRINKSFFELFLQQLSPFNKPLVQNLVESSGGFWSYLQIPISKSLIVTIDTAGVFSQFNIRQLPRDTIIQSWTNSYNNSYLINEFNKNGNYPKNNLSQTNKDSSVVNLLPNQTVQLFSKSGNYTIDGITMKLPQLDYSSAAFIKDNGTFHRGTSKFTMKINGNADSVLLIKRSNKSYGLNMNFRAMAENLTVLVDNQNAGNWQNKKYRTYRYWENDTFKIPKNLFQGKSQLALQVKFVSGESCNEYYYWINCDGVNTDSINVGTPSSESAHSYSVTNVQVNLYNEINNRYNSPNSVKQNNQRILDSLYIKIYFDGETSPSVNAPIGLFFATGVNDATYSKSIPCGNINGEFYNYFSMPFWSNARIELENISHQSIDNVFSRILTSNNTATKKELGYFKTIHNKAIKNYSDNTDYLVANIDGKGKYVGTIIEAVQVNDTFFCWLEGDEHIYVDDAQTPVFIGTGTEDYFNSTFYFFFDEYSLQQNGCTNSDDFYHKSMYRFHLTDPINFEKNIRFQIEHGDFNNKLGIYNSLAFLYVQPSSCVLTDSLDVGNTISEQLHNYTTPNNKIFINKNSSFEGEKYQQILQHDGYAITDSVEFVATVSPFNKGVRLLRTLDYSNKNQTANIYIDNNFVGTWCNAGFNNFSSFRDEYFVIPESYTKNKSSISIKCVNQNPSTKWTELMYKVYSIIDSSLITTVKNQMSSTYKIFPTITNHSVSIQNYDSQNSTFVLQNNTGEILQIIKNQKSNITTLDLNKYAAGVYFISILQDDKIIKTEKIILVH